MRQTAAFRTPQPDPPRDARSFGLSCVKRGGACVRLLVGVFVLSCLLAIAAAAHAADPAAAGPGGIPTADAHEGVQVVGLVPAPPFAMQDGEGNWIGLAVDLWRHVAQDLGLRFEFREMAIPDLIAGLQRGDLLAVVTGSASAERELVVDFSHPYYSSGFAIAVPVRTTSDTWFGALGQVISAGTAKITGVLFGLLFVVAVLVWLSERRSNPDHFSPQPLRGIADGLWWAAVTLTTVGYGDKAPRTRLGRIIGMVWMFAAVILIALFTAQVTSALTVTSLTGRVRGPADLVHVRVGTVQDSPAQVVLRSRFGVPARGYPGFGHGLAALDRGDIDAFVGAEPILRYEIANAFQGDIVIVGAPFMRVDYVFALPLGSPIRRQVNRSILNFIESDEWRNLLHQYLGADL